MILVCRSASPAASTGRNVSVGRGSPALWAVSIATVVAALSAEGRAEPTEPSVDRLCRAAVAQAMAEPERARAFISRARLAGWLPEVHFRAYRRFARTEGLTFGDMGTGTIAPVDINAVDDVRYEWRASWDLSRMVFNPDELQAHAEALRMADVRRDIQSVVIKLYFERRRLLLSADGEVSATPALSASSGDKSAAGEIRAARDQKRQLRIAEIEAQLAAISGEAFAASGTGERRAATSP